MTTTPVTDWSAAEAHLATHTGTNAHTLPALTALLGTDLHHLVLDPDTRTIWWAWDKAAVDMGEGWAIDQLDAEAAAENFSDTIDTIHDRLADHDLYNSYDAFELDQDALDEYTEILRLTLPADAAEARSAIKRRRDLLARQDQLLQRADANLVRDLVGTEHGGAARAARALNITQTQTSRLITEDDRRFANTAMAVKAALAER
jgi:hypothetical protein